MVTTYSSLENRSVINSSLRNNQISVRVICHYHTLLILFGLVFLVLPNCASAMYYPVPDGPCVTGSANTYSDGNNMSCYPNSTGVSSGQFTYGANSKWSVGKGSTLKLPNARVPVTGNYSIQAYICAQNGTPCTMARSSQVLPQSASFLYTQGSLFDNINNQAGSGSTNFTTSYASNMCVVVIGPDGNPWKLPGTLLTCSDANSLPTTPSFCTITTSEINVDFANLERSKIATSPLSTVAKHGGVQVVCYGSAAVSYSMRFEYTPVTIGGSQLVSTSNPSLGVAIIYNGVVMTNASNTNLSYNGTTTLDLQFEVVRNSSVNIASGNFTGAAILVMTLQ